MTKIVEVTKEQAASMSLNMMKTGSKIAKFKFADGLHRLIQDNDCHWYVIEADKENLFYKWEEAMEKCKPWKKKWEPTPVNGPHSVLFENWSETKYD